MERVVVDLTELPFECHLSHDRWILVLVDYFSSYVWGATFPTKESVVMKLLEILVNLGPCELLASDR